MKRITNKYIEKLNIEVKRYFRELDFSDDSGEDQKTLHNNMDNILLECLSELGLPELVTVFLCIKKEHID